jgi:hypothetical protein
MRSDIRKNARPVAQCRVASSSGVNGSRGSSCPSARLQFGQGAPAPPQLQACGPCLGRSGWFSQTQPQLSQGKHMAHRNFGLSRYCLPWLEKTRQSLANLFPAEELRRQIHAVNTFAPGAREYEVIADRALSELVETQAAGMPVFACCHEVQIQPPFAPSSCQGMSSL